MQTLELIRSRFAKALQGIVDNPEEHARRVQTAKDARFGDYQANLVMGLAKQLGRDHDGLAIAQELADKVPLSDLCETIEVAGRGFINLRLRDSWIEDMLSDSAADPRLGVSHIAQPLTYVVDYSSPNVAKPLHVGHLRSMVIGDAIVRILRFVGHQVISDNHLGDWGTQFGMVIFGYKHFVDEEAYQRAPVLELSRLYRLVHQLIEYHAAVSSIPKLQADRETAQARWEQSRKAAETTPADKKLAKNIKTLERQLEEAESALSAAQSKIADVERNPQLVERAKAFPNIDRDTLQETAKLHAGDVENRQLWEKFLPHCIADIHSIYQRLKISFDYEYGESFYHDMLAPVVDDLVKRGLASESDGAICVFLKEYDAPMIIRKKDGAFLYATTDLATVEYRMQHFHPHAILYVVDHRQSEHFNKLFATLKTVGYSEVDFRHISFGTVLGKDGKPFKTRSGTSLDLVSLLDEAVARAWQVVCNQERLQAASLDMDDAEKRQIAEVVGIGAIKYADLHHNRTSDYIFDIDKMVQLDGNTAAYIQYSYARTMSILRRANVDVTDPWRSNLKFQVSHPAERQLGLQLLQFEECLHQSLEDFCPNILANYLYDLAKQFSSFFDQCSVLRAETEDLARSRQGLVYLTGQTLKQGLELLGIDVVPRM